MKRNHLHSVSHAKMNGGEVCGGSKNILFLVVCEAATVKCVCDRHVAFSVKTVIWFYPERTEFVPEFLQGKKSEICEFFRCAFGQLPKSNAPNYRVLLMCVDRNNDVVLFCNLLQLRSSLCKKVLFVLRCLNNLINPPIVAEKIVPRKVFDSWRTKCVEQVCWCGANRACRKDCKKVFAIISVKKSTQHDSSVCEFGEIIGKDRKLQDASHFFMIRSV